MVTVAKEGKSILKGRVYDELVSVAKDRYQLVKISITDYIMSINHTPIQNILHVGERDEISKSPTPEKVPSNIIDRVIALEEIIGLEGGTSSIVKRVELLGETIFINVKNYNGGMMKVTSIIKEKMGFK